MPVSRRMLWLVGALAAAIAVAVWSRSPPPAPTAAGQQAPARPPAQTPGADAGPVDVKLEALEVARQAPQEGQRNPFRFQTRQASSPAEPAPDSSTLAPPVAVPTGPPPLPPIALKFIGTMEKSDGTKVAVLSGNGYTLHGKEGEAVEGRYRILKIGVESLEIAYLDGRGRQTIRQTGQ